MKKLLSILAAVGMTATASTAVVACTTNVKASDVKIAKDGTATIEKKSVELPSKLDKAMKSGDTLDLSTYKFVLFKDKKTPLKSTVKSVTLTKDAKKDAKSVQATIVLSLDKSEFDKKLDITMGTEKDGKLDKAAIKFNIKKAADWADKDNGGTTPDKPTTDKKATVANGSFAAGNLVATFAISGGEGKDAKIADVKDANPLLTEVTVDGAKLDIKTTTDAYTSEIKDGKLIVTLKAAATQSLSINFAGNEQIEANAALTATLAQ